MKEDEGRRIAVVKAFEIAEKKSQDLNAKLLEAERDKKSIEAALDVVERQAETQCKLLRQAKYDLATARSQIKVLTKKLEEAEKAKEQTKQEGYEVGVTETEEALRAEVAEVCRFYCLQVWNETHNQAGVEASSALTRVEKVYYPLAIRPLGSLGSKVDPVSSKANEGKASSSKALPIANISPKEAGQAKDTEKAADSTKEVAYDAEKVANPSKEKKAA